MTIKEYELPHDAIGREIGIISPHEFGDSEGFIIYFTDGTSLEIEDDPDCCEVRWMHTDDDLDYYAGSTLVGVELRDGPTVDGDCGEVEETMFLLITTSLGVVTIAAHNNHNGYYGGISPRYIFKGKP